MTYKKKIKKCIKDVMEDNGYEEYDKQAVESLVNEFNSRIKLNFFTEIDGEKVEMVNAGKTNDGWILNFYKKVERRDNTGTYGYGYAYNLEAPELSEWGSLWIPNP